MHFEASQLKLKMTAVFRVRSFQKNIYIRLYILKCGYGNEHGKINVNVRKNKSKRGLSHTFECVKYYHQFDSRISFIDFSRSREKFLMVHSKGCLLAIIQRNRIFLYISKTLMINVYVSKLTQTFTFLQGRLLCS